MLDYLTKVLYEGTEAQDKKTILRILKLVWIFTAPATQMTKVFLNKQTEQTFNLCQQSPPQIAPQVLQQVHTKIIEAVCRTALLYFDSPVAKLHAVQSNVLEMMQAAKEILTLVVLIGQVEQWKGVLVQGFTQCYPQV